MKYTKKGGLFNIRKYWRTKRNNYLNRNLETIKSLWETTFLEITKINEDDWLHLKFNNINTEDVDDVVSIKHSYCCFKTSQTFILF